MTLRALSASVNLSPSMLSKLEEGERNPSRAQILRIAKALGLNIPKTDELLISVGEIPMAYEDVSPLDPDVLLVVRLLGDKDLSEEERARIRLFIRLMAKTWRPSSLADADVIAITSNTGRTTVHV